MIVKSKLSRAERLNLLHRENPRRGFLKGAFSFLMLPSIYSFLNKATYAQGLNCPAWNPMPSPMMPIMFLEHPGGAHFAAEDVVIGGPAGQLDNTGFTSPDSLDRFGIPSDSNYHSSSGSNLIDNRLGLAFHVRSPFLAGVLETLPTAYRKSVDGFSVATITRSDTNVNPFSGVHLAYALGRTGTAVHSIGSRPTLSGTRSRPVIDSVRPESMPALVRNRNEARALAGDGRILAALNQAEATRIWAAMAKMGSAQLRRFEQLGLSDQLKTLIDCNLLRVKDIPFVQGQGPYDLFPESEDHPDYIALKTAFGDDFLTNSGNGILMQQAAIYSRLLFGGFAGAAALSSRLGYDNHDGTASAPNNRRKEAGRRVGAIFHYAALMEKSVMIVLTTDGAMRPRINDGVLEIDDDEAGRGFGNKPGDSDENSMLFVLTYIHGHDRTTAPIAENDRRQIGAYNPFGVMNVHRSSTDNKEAVHAIMYNYLRLHGLESRMANISSNPGQFDAPEYRMFRPVLL